ncbi:LuxR family transcriptional regulator [Rhodovulum bhavnagarense]|uniref:LuxR family transcriptional regulator n=1 Tax=Rhodovulum bhavnagarense TaxID=992286 RepID=A0A4R2RLF9_9RHOB|nr:LuxR family transcriptional regulator [Rhodovulum bhavnagarense]TCP60571.1 LuxR family transcriptional regulator [Rhodovulum bhavnagarense]
MIVDHLRSVVAATTIEELWALHTRKMEEYGFDRLLYGLTHFKTHRSLGDPEDVRLLSSHDEAYTRGFVDQRLFENAPMVQWAAENEGHCSWKLMQDAYRSGALSAAERRVVEFNRERGVVAGYTISFRQISVRCKGAIGLSASPGTTQDDVDAVWALHGADIMLMNEVMHLKILDLPSGDSRRLLTPRQCEVLEWVGDGKTTQDIATILGVSPATVEKHLRLARQALGVETTAQAVLKAWFQKQIFVVPPRKS